MSRRHYPGQGLLELIIAIGVITVGLFAVWGLFMAQYTAEREAQARVTGANLAREGVELVKNIRDSNWLAIDDNAPCRHGVEIAPCAWDSGLPSGRAIINSIYQATESALLTAVPSFDDERTRLGLTADGWYDHDAIANATPYRRLLTIERLCCADADGNGRCDAVDVDFRVSDACSASEAAVGLQVTSEVRWLFNGQPRESVIQEHLFNWR